MDSMSTGAKAKEREQVKTNTPTDAPVNDPMEGYVPKAHPRKEYSGEKDSAERISSNLNRINKRYVATPYKNENTDEKLRGEPVSTQGTRLKATRIPSVKSENSAISRKRVAGAVKTRVEVITEKNERKKPFPLAVILCCLAVTISLMYVISLYIHIDDYSSDISDLKGEISSYNDQITALELRLENKYDLDEIERIAVEEYGMVRADKLPKKYVSLAGDDVIEITTPDKSSGIGNLLSVFAALFGFGE